MAQQQQQLPLAIGAVFVLLLLSQPAWAGIIAQPALSYAADEHAVAHTQQNVLRSYDGTVSHYAKSVATPYSQVHKQDTRISNNVYQPAYAAPAAVVAPAAQLHQVYTQHQPAAVYAQHQPAAVYTEHQPAVVHAQPAVVHTQPAAVYSHAAPVAHAAYASHQQPAVVHYSPAESVSHMSFDGFGTHWGF
ncbi:hypothetical protein KR222_001290 [Zaprionus bogoriensis]|nr:hypothetical protein KR222_001290 [Zaprionus bogoriensis]